jgi:hypothetical protein
MSAREIPKSEWKEFFRDFARFHPGWLTSLDIFSSAMGAQKEANEMTLTGLVAETRRDGKLTIDIMLGETAENHIRHTIVAPTQVRHESQSESEVLQIEDDSRTTVLISCHRSGTLAKAMYGFLQKR